MKKFPKKVDLIFTTPYGMAYINGFKVAPGSSIARVIYTKPGAEPDQIISMDPLPDDLYCEFNYDYILAIDDGGVISIQFEELPNVKRKQAIEKLIEHYDSEATLCEAIVNNRAHNPIGIEMARDKAQTIRGVNKDLKRIIDES